MLARRAAFHRCLLAALCVHTGAMPVQAQGAWNTLRPGAEVADCRSALRPGLRDCRAAADDDADAIAQAPPAKRTADRDLEARVDEFLANFGKPPREAVRALLDPSDAHVLEYLRAQNHTVSVAAYVAERMTRLQKGLATGLVAISPEDSAGEDRYAQMKVTWTGGAHEEEIRPALQALHAVVLRHPLLQVAARLPGTPGTLQAQDLLPLYGAVLSLERFQPDAVNLEDLPQVQLEDLRFHKAVSLPAGGMSAQGLLNAIVEFRRGNTLHASVPGAP